MADSPRVNIWCTRHHRCSSDLLFQLTATSHYHHQHHHKMLPLGRRFTHVALVAFTGLAVMLSVFAVQNNHHKAAMDYLNKLMRLKVLQILYPQQHFTMENYTSFRFMDPVIEEVFERFNEKDAPEAYIRENATFFSLVRNEELYLMLESIRYTEDRFNKKYHYDWLFANDKEFTEEFKVEVSNMVSGKATFVTIPHEYWSYPEYIDQSKAEQTRNFMKKQGIKYGGSESYRFMCRFNSGFFYKLNELDPYRYYWRVEPDIKFECDISMDPFKFMRENKIKYGFTMTLHELHNTVFGLYEATKEFFHDLHPTYTSKDHQVEFVTQDQEKTFNMCHYWSNFEIGDLDFYRSKEYEEYFQHLESKGGFFYERWGDAPIHTFAVSYMLNKDEVHYFDNTGYYHVPHTQCPRLLETREELHCTCQLANDFNWGSRDSCLPYWYETRNVERPSWAPRRLYDTHRENSPGNGKRQYLEDEVDNEVDSMQDMYLERIPTRKAFEI